MGLKPRHLTLVAALLLVGPWALSAQSILVQVSEAETGLPIQGAFLSLYRQDGSLVRHTLSNAQGRFIFTPGVAGNYTVRAQMIGRESVEREGVIVGPGEVAEVNLGLSFHPIPLRAIEVQAEERCRVFPEEASALTAVWEEARKALTVQEWAEGAQLFRFQVVNYQRDMDPEDRYLGTEARQILQVVSSNPIRSLPVEELTEKGYVQEQAEGGWEFWGPDAAVLLSDEFLESHCFHLRSYPDSPVVLGLAFEPLNSDGKTDIQGTLWLERETAALRFLEFSPVWDEFPNAKGVAKGRIDFERLPGGAWIVRKWWIRMPHLSLPEGLAGAGRSDVYVSGIRESGAQVEKIHTVDGDRVDEVETGAVEGVAWDHTDNRPLDGAEVYLSGTSHFSVADSAGRFRLENVPEGSYLLGFGHNRLNAIGVHSRGVEVEVKPNSTSRAGLSFPTPDGIVRQSCRAEEREMGQGFLTGVVRHRSTGVGIPDALVTVYWDQVVHGSFDRVHQRVRVQAHTDAGGRYIACGLPLVGRIYLQAEFLDWKSNRRSVYVPHEEYPVVDVEINVKGEGSHPS